MLGYKILHGGDLNENGNFRHGKLIIHGYIILHGGDLKRNEKIQRQIIHLISWDRRINVISCWLLKYLLHFSDPFLPPQVGRHREWDSEARNGDWNAPHGPGGGQESVHLDFPRDAGFSHCCFQQLVVPSDFSPDSQSSVEWKFFTLQGK